MPNTLAEGSLVVEGSFCWMDLRTGFSCVCSALRQTFKQQGACCGVSGVSIVYRFNGLNRGIYSGLYTSKTNKFALCFSPLAIFDKSR